MSASYQECIKCGLLQDRYFKLQAERDKLKDELDHIKYQMEFYCGLEENEVTGIAVHIRRLFLHLQHETEGK